MSPIELIVNGRTLRPPVGPRLRGEQVWIPVHPVVEALGGRVDAAEHGQVLVLRFGKESLRLRLGDLDQAVMLGSTAMTPADTIESCLNVEVNWQAESQRIEVELQGKPVVRRQPGTEEEEEAQPEAARTPKRPGGKPAKEPAGKAARPGREPKPAQVKGQREHLPTLWLRDLNGQPVCLQQYRGKRTAIFVWGSWAESSKELSAWQLLYERNRKPEVEILAIAADASGAAAVQAEIERMKASFPVLIDECSLLPAAMKLTTIPAVVLADELGAVQVAKLDPRALSSWLSEKPSKQPPGRRSAKPAKGMNKPLEAVPAIERSLRTDAQNGELRLRLADALAAAGEYARAARQYRKTISLLPQSALAHFRLGVCLLRVNDHRGAQTALRDAVKQAAGNDLITKQVAALEQRMTKAP